MKIKDIINFLVNTLLPVLRPVLIQKGLRAFIIAVRREVIESETKVDDFFVLPLLEIISKTLDIDESIPGDIDNRIQGTKDRMNKLGLKDSQVNWDDINTILTSPGIWQENIDEYLNKVKNDKK